jgi:C-terminal processing protease CtpA/Prc
VSINHRGIAPDIELEREPESAAPLESAPAPPDVPLEQRDPEVKRAIQELKVPMPGGSGSTTAALSQ